MTGRVRRAFVAAGFAVLASGAVAQGISVEPGQQWKVNDEVRYERLTTRTAASSTTARTPITVRVVEVRPDGYVVSWRYGRTELAPPVSETTEPIEGLKALMENTELMIELNSRGAFGSLRNWEQVRDTALAIVEQLPMPANMPEVARKELSSARSRLFSTKEGVESVLLSEVQLFFLFYGRRLDSGQERKYDQVPNPMGGAPLPATAMYKLESADTNTATLRYELELDREKAGKALADSFVALAARAGKPMQPAEVDAIVSSLNINDIAVLVFDLATRWPVSLTYGRRMKMQGRSRLDRVEYRRQP
jgi:hypothetical protein